MSGIVLVTVPIGDPEDITIKALNYIKRTKRIYSEDTRVFKDLCKRLEIDYTDKIIQSFHDHSGPRALEKILDFAKSEECVFVSDAGSPIISDPAFPLVTSALCEGVELKTASGVSAINCALELSGLAPTPFHFHGFTGRDKSSKNQDIETIKMQYGTHIFFEGVSRVKSTLAHLCSVLADYDFVVARELTKSFESLYRFKGSDYDSISDDITEKGEFVILVRNENKSKSHASKEILKVAQDILDKGAKPKLIAKLVGEITGIPSKKLYQKLSKGE